MNNAELEHLSLMLSKARSPEEVFGTLTGTRSEMLEAARKVFRHMAKVAHPDIYQGTADFVRAGAAFKRLTTFWGQAQARIEQDIYGTTSTTETFEPFILRTSTRQYTIERLLTRGDLCGLYISTFRGNSVHVPSAKADKRRRALLKIPMKPADNDLVANEARILGHLRVSDDYEKRRHFVSQLIDNFSYHEQETGVVRNVNVLAYTEGLYTLKEVREAHKAGIDPKDMAWIWRRLLVALGFAHTNRVLHGAVLPTHILIHPQQHGLVLIDWSYAVLHAAKTGERISAISSAYREWYPAEVFAREEPTPGLDIAMAGRCMIDLIGGNPHTCTMPERIPWQLRNYLKGCTLLNPRQRPQDTELLLADFDELIERLWGPRTFRKFPFPLTTFEQNQAL